jgi:hypothetical protein
MKKILKIFLISAALLLLLLLAVFIISWKSPDYYKPESVKTSPINIIPFENYGSISNHARPFILNSTDYVIFGAEHTMDPDDPQIKMIEEEWNALKPTIALVEGRLGFLFPGLMDPVKELGEGGYVKYLAHRDNVPLYNWDLSKEVLADSMVKKFPAEQVALAQILNPYFGTLRHGKPESPESFISGYLHRAKFAGMQDSIKSSDDIDRIWKKYFGDEMDWRNVSDEYPLPGFLGEMMRYTNDLRNRHLVRVIKELLQNNEKPFIICGSSHAVCIQPAFIE